MHFFHSYVLPKFNSVYMRVLHFYPGLELKNYTSVYMRLSLYAIIYSRQVSLITKKLPITADNKVIHRKLPIATFADNVC